MPIDISLLHSVKWDADVISMWHWKQAPSLLSQSGFRLCRYWTSPICQGGDGACCITGFPPSSHCNAQTDFHLLFATVLSRQSWEITVTEEVWWLPKEVVTVAFGYPCKYLNTQRAPPLKVWLFPCQESVFSQPWYKVRQCLQGLLRTGCPVINWFATIQ